MVSVTCDACQSIIPRGDRNAVDVTYRYQQHHLCAGCAAPVVAALQALGLPDELDVIRA